MKITNEEVEAIRTSLQEIYRHKWMDAPTFDVLRKVHQIFDRLPYDSVPKNKTTSERVLLVIHLLHTVENTMIQVGKLTEKLDQEIANCHLDIEEEN